jgi:SAM-dependent methyltransferase
MRAILNFPTLYNLFSRIIASNTRVIYVGKYIRPKKSDRILDIGCGTGDILSHLPDVDYFGLDINQAYIEHAKKRFLNQGQFLTAKIDKEMAKKYSLADFDIVLATGVLHHLNDDEAATLFETAKAALKTGGRLITLDGCFLGKQSRITRFILSKDRGKYVRTKEAYLSLAQKSFTNVQVSIHHDLLRIPFTHIIMECAA